MKKFIFTFCMGLLIPTLTACNVNWFGETRQISPWLLGATIVSVLFIALAVCLAAGKRLSEKTFVCQNCGKHFHPEWLSAAFASHVGDHHVFRCPHCNKKGFCPPVRE